MGIQGWTYTIVGLTFGLYLLIAVWSRASSTSGFYVAGRGVPSVANGMATGADWMSAASFISMAGLMLVISTSVSHDLMKSIFRPDLSDRAELAIARTAAAFAVLAAGLVGIYPPAYVAQVVAFAFGLAAASFFPVLVLGVFSLRTTRQGAIAGMLTGIGFTASYIIYFKFIASEAGAARVRRGACASC